MAGSPTASAEHIADDERREEMSAEEKLPQRTDELIRRVPRIPLALDCSAVPASKSP